MTKEAALYSFFSNFGLPAFEENSVPSQQEFPYLTYELATSDFDHPVPIAVSLWFRSTSWLAANLKARQISTAISRGGVTIPCDNGAIWITRGEPFVRSSGDGSDSEVKRKLLNLTVEFFTED